MGSFPTAVVFLLDSSASAPSIRVVDFDERTINRIAEIAITICSILYLLLIMRERRSGWWFGIAASLISAWLFIRLNLLAESSLYVFYVLAGLYGYFHWRYGSGTEKEIPISTRTPVFHLVALLVCGLLTGALAVLLDRMGSALAPLDAATTTFSIFATWLTARKILENWIYWIIIDAATVWLYLSRDAPVYAGLMVFYTVMACAGFVVWVRRMRDERRATK